MNLFNFFLIFVCLFLYINLSNKQLLTGVQKIDGLTGPIVVRDVLAAEPYAHLYDYDLFEHEIFIQDWTHTTADSLIPGLKREGSLPKSLLINGRGIKSSEVSSFFIFCF